jgi:serine/threonine protein kinase
VSTSFVTELKRSKYRLLGLVGQGQFGQVYCASHRKTGRLVALKELDRTRFPTNKFLRELRFLLSLQHPNIVTCHALEHTRTGRYLVMDYCEGGTLRSLMENEFRLQTAQSLKLVADVLVGLDHAHSKGIIHCDIKPENILLNVTDRGWNARISDFGISKLIQEISSESTGNTGSPAYMAPERFYGQHSHSSDIYAVGILLYEILVGHRPFSGIPLELMSAHLNNPVRIPENIPVTLQSVILTALQKLQARRFSSARHMLTALQAAATEIGIQFNADPLDLTPPQPAAPTQCCFKAFYQEKLRVSIRQLHIKLLTTSTQNSTIKNLGNNLDPLIPPKTERLYWVTGNQVGCQFFAHEILALDTLQQITKAQSATVRLPESVQELAAFPAGCFVKTQSALYLLSDASFAMQATQGKERLRQIPTSQVTSEFSLPKSILKFQQNFLVAIESRGAWIATATSSDAENHTTLKIWKTSGTEYCQQSLPNPFPNLFRLLTLDSRHIAAFFRSPQENAQPGVFVQVVARRGQRLGVLHLPVVLKQVVLSAKPHRIAATEQHNPNSLLLIDLKPLRITRIALEIVPVLVTATPWGYVLADTQGQVVFLDSYGQRIGRIEVPGSPSALTSFEGSGLMISTWNSEQGYLYMLDLKQLGLDFLF